MKVPFKGWSAVKAHLLEYADTLREMEVNGEAGGLWQLNRGQRASLRAIARALPDNGIIVADEVGMGKTRIAVTAGTRLSVARRIASREGEVAASAAQSLATPLCVECRRPGRTSPVVRRTRRADFACRRELVARQGPRGLALAFAARAVRQVAAVQKDAERQTASHCG
jgi:hypothetical protein